MGTIFEGVCRCGLCLALQRIRLLCGAPERTALFRAFAVDKVRAFLGELLDFGEGSKKRGALRAHSSPGGPL